MSLLLGGTTVLSTDGTLSAAFTQEFGDIWIAIIVVCLFTALYRVELNGKTGRILAFGAGGCYGGYLLSHLLDAWCYKLAPQWHAPAHYTALFGLITVPIFITSLLGGKLLQLVTNCLLPHGKGKLQ